jgi:hypothetical protein
VPRGVEVARCLGLTKKTSGGRQGSVSGQHFDSVWPDSARHECYFHLRGDDAGPDNKGMIASESDNGQWSVGQLPHASSRPVGRTVAFPDACPAHSYARRNVPCGPTRLFAFTRKRGRRRLIHRRTARSCNVACRSGWTTPAAALSSICAKSVRICTAGYSDCQWRHRTAVRL